jgi:hypothetical protein
VNSITHIDDVRFVDIAPTKFGIELMADAIAEKVKAGEVEALPLQVKLKAVEELVKAVNERVKPVGLDELAKHPKHKAEVLGAAIAIVDIPKYDYSHIPAWSELDAQIRELTERKKAIEEEEKKYRRGELPVLSNTTAIKINLAK